jgi:alanine racemase
LIIEAVQNDIHVAIYDMDKASEYVEILKIFGGRLKAHLKVETGMGRLGMPLSQAADFLMQYQNNDWIQIDGIFTHFARADEPGSGSAQAQLSQFNRFLDQIQQAGLRPGIVHAANSAAVVNFPEAYYDMVRPGIAIFGLDPAPNAPLSGSFKPALTWKARLTSVRVFPRGHGISYGSSYITSKEERIGVVPVGYGDGYRREPGQKVLIQGKEVDVVGRICMDQFMVQLDDVPEARPGDEVVLLGKQGDQQITAMDIANRWGCLHYEVVCGLADRLPRLYFES